MKLKTAICAILINTTAFSGFIYAGSELKAQEVDAALAEFHAEELECMALNIYYETRASSLIDAVSVSDVVLNRVESSRYPSTVCGVVHDGYRSDRKSCQFSWYCDGKSDVPQDDESWEKSRKHARDMYIHQTHRGITESATHYHATYVSPYWAPSMHRVARMGAHIFYRED